MKSAKHIGELSGWLFHVVSRILYVQLSTILGEMNGNDLV